MKIVRESINFKRDQDPKKSLGVGSVTLNRDPDKRIKQFRKDNPDIQYAYNSKSHTISFEPMPFWEILNVSYKNSKRSLEENKERVLKWCKDNTDYDIIEIDHAYERKFHPWGNKEGFPEEVEHGIKIKMRDKDHIR